MKYVVHCPYNTKDKVRKIMDEAKFFNPGDRVVYFDADIDSVQVEHVVS